MKPLTHGHSLGKLQHILRKEFILPLVLFLCVRCTTVLNLYGEPNMLLVLSVEVSEELQLGSVTL